MTLAQAAYARSERRLWSPGPPARSVVLCIPWPAAHTTACGTGMGVLPCTLDQQVFQI